MVWSNARANRVAFAAWVLTISIYQLIYQLVQIGLANPPQKSSARARARDNILYIFRTKIYLVRFCI
jgi:hypothetical protein